MSDLQNGNAVPRRARIEKPKDKVILAIEELSRELRANQFVKGKMQFTDITNRDYFLKAYGDRIRYCRSWNKFLVWNGNNWEIDNRGLVEEWILEFVHKMYRGLRCIKDPVLKADFEKHLIKSESFRRLQALNGVLKMTAEIKVGDSEMDNNIYLFNAKGVTIDLNYQRGREPAQADLLTKCSNFVFDKNAVCPTWEKFLMQIFNNDFELIHYVQKAMGYCLTGDVSEQCLFILWGTGANGKSTFLNTVQKLFGDYACTTGTETFMRKSSEQSNDIARLMGKRLVTTSEAEQGKALSESLIKQITGEDELTARFLYGEYFSFKPTFKIFMATNHKPRIRGSDEGIWRRIKLIPFEVTIPPEQRDRHLAEKLEMENSGIFNWLLKGYQLWKKEGLEAPEAVQNANDEYRFDMDSVGTFIAEVMNVDASGICRLSNKTLYDVYCRWCNKNNEKQMSQKSLAMRMQEKGYKRIVSNSTRMWLGLGVKPEWLGDFNRTVF